MSCPNTIGNGPAICCDSCEKWFHGNCVGLTQLQIDMINETEGVMWLLRQFRPTVKTTIQSGLANLNLDCEKKRHDDQRHGRRWDCTKQIFEKIEGIQEDRTACESIVTGLKPNLVAVKRKNQQHSNTLTQHKMTYAAKCAPTLSDPTEKKASWSEEISSRYFLWKTHTAALPTVLISKRRTPNISQIKN